WAALLYTMGGVAWCACLAGMGAWSRALARLSVPLYALFAAVSIAPLVPGLPSWMVGAGNALGFVGLEAWFFLALEAVVRLRRPDTPHGRWAPWRAPRARLLARFFDALAGSRALRRALEILPVLEFRSDIEDVVYVSYLVPAEALAALVPQG